METSAIKFNIADVSQNTKVDRFSKRPHKKFSVVQEVVSALIVNIYITDHSTMLKYIVQ